MKTVPLRRLVASLDNGAWGEDPEESEAETTALCIRAADFAFSELRVDTSRAPMRGFDERTVRRLRLCTGDIVLEKSGGGVRLPVGRSVLFDHTVSAVPTNFAARLRPASGVDPRYLVYVLRHLYESGATARAIKQTTGIQNLDTDAWLASEAPHPLSGEQRRIADFLDDRVSRIDRIIAARREQLSLIARAQHSMMSELLDRQSESSGSAPLRRFCAGIEQGSSPVAEDHLAGPAEPGVLKTSAVFRGAFFSSRHKALDPSDADDRYRVQEGDVIITRGSGSAELVGDAAVARIDEQSPSLYLSDLTYRLVGLELLPEYVLLAIISARGRSELGSRVRQGSGPAKARGDDIMAIPVPIASPEEQRACIAAEASRRERSAVLTSGVACSIDLLTEYKTSLITAAVTGELDVTTAGSSIPG